MARSLTTFTLLVGLLSLALGLLYNTFAPTIRRVILVMGISRHDSAIEPADPANLVLIEGTRHCEDIHYHEPSHFLYTACEDSHSTRFGWFPPLASFNASVLNQARGGLVVINPETRRAQKLKLEEFDGPFITHGIDVISNPAGRADENVYILAVNHLPNPHYYSYTDGYSVRPEAIGKGHKVPKARSQIEIFHHTVGSSTARHVRSVRHPLITTPNDIVALSPTSFLVTNDHFYRDGFMRHVEDLYPGAAWTNTVHVKVSDLLAAEPDNGVTASVVVDSIHNNNGLGHGMSNEQILVTSAAGGTLHLGELSSTTDGGPVQIVDVISFDSTIDNPSYFPDRFANEARSVDAGGFVLAGLWKASDLSKTKNDPHARDPVVVWYATRTGTSWNKRLIFQDDGSLIRTASAAVLVGIDPAKENGERRAWLYVTGFSSAAIIATKVEL